MPLGSEERVVTPGPGPGVHLYAKFWAAGLHPAGTAV